MDQKIKQLISLVTRMRTMQSASRQNPKNPGYYAQSRELEKLVDEKIKEITHGQMF